MMAFATWLPDPECHHALDRIVLCPAGIILGHRAQDMFLRHTPPRLFPETFRPKRQGTGYFHARRIKSERPVMDLMFAGVRRNLSRRQATAGCAGRACMIADAAIKVLERGGDAEP
jgi:hypothetical protein